MTMDPQDAPDYRMLWDRVAKARKLYECDGCHEAIQPETKYRSVGYLLDGAFEQARYHGNGGYPSDCPKFAERDRQEIEQQFEQDAALWNAEVVRCHCGKQAVLNGLCAACRGDRNVP